MEDSNLLFRRSCVYASYRGNRRVGSGTYYAIRTTQPSTSMNNTENNQEGAPLEHAAEANREREQEQALTPEGAGAEGNGSVFGNAPRIVSHSTGLPLDQAAAAAQEDAGRAPQDYGKDSGDAHQHGAEGTNPSGDLVNNTGADPTGARTGADAASG